MLSNELKTTFWIIPRKALSSLKYRRKKILIYLFINPAIDTAVFLKNLKILNKFKNFFCL